MKIPKELPNKITIKKTYWSKIPDTQLKKVLTEVNYEIKRKETKKGRVKNRKLFLIPLEQLKFTKHAIQGEFDRREKDMKELELNMEEHK